MDRYCRTLYGRTKCQESIGQIPREILQSTSDGHFGRLSELTSCRSPVDAKGFGQPSTSTGLKPTVSEAVLD